MKTIYKINLARIIYKSLILFGIKRKISIYKSSIKWSLDLSEGIDLSIFLFGAFQKSIISSILNLIKKINKKNNRNKINFIDVGSNIGDKSLTITRKLLDQNIDNFQVYSIEPTEFAYNKQIKNINLNEDLKKKISLFNYFISNKKKKYSKIYSSWSLKEKNNKHNIHGGFLKKIRKNTQNISLDYFFSKKRIKNNIIVKIDVDGFELNVLKSCEKSIRKENIVFFMEYAPYAFEEHGANINQFFSFVKKNNLKTYDLNFKQLNYIKIGKGQSIDIILAKKNFFEKLVKN